MTTNITTNYTKIPNELLKVNISSMAKLLWISIQSKPSNYIISQKNLAEEFDVCTLTIRKAIRELKDNNLLVINKMCSDNGCFWQYEIKFPGYDTVMTNDCIKHLEVFTKYFICPNAVITDNNISKRARLVFFLILSKPDHYNINQRGLATELKLNKMTVNKAIKELKKTGYLFIETFYDKKSGTSKSKYKVGNIKNFKPNKTYQKMNKSNNKPSKKQLKLAQTINLNLSKKELKQQTMNSFSKLIKIKLENSKELPTKKQRKYARKLGIDQNIIESSNRKKLSRLIKVEINKVKSSAYKEPIWEKVEVTKDMITSSELEALLGFKEPIVT